MDPWRGGLVSRAELDAAGVTRRGLERMLAAGTLERVRSGWYARPGLSATERVAARSGGRLCCLSAAGRHGLWIPPNVDERVHLLVPQGTHSDNSRAVVHWRASARRTRLDDRLVVPPLLTLDTVIRCQPAETAFVVVESALALGVVSMEAWERLLLHLPARLRAPLLLASDESGSGTESAFVFRIRRRGVRDVQQIKLGPDRVDVELDDGTLVELDSRAHHDGLVDARRDARTGILGRETLRFRYEQVWFEWTQVDAAVFAARRRRMRRRRPGRPGMH